ncbi:E3 ubiquitin-protein ligase bre1 [Tritrichomonas musculus]|uniref:E3 ubiquitin protein ligase n=1 Tax=Tritrichomonas musculus TaxID=1915356 RepID=A0ABR2KES6_9EUKA
MIKAPIELYPGNHDSDTFLLSLPPPPTSFLAQFEQLSTYVKYVQNQCQNQENELMHNIKPVLDVLTQCELLAFDLAVFLDGSRRDEIHGFFEKCFSITDGNYSFNINNPKSTLAHFKYILNFISNMNIHYHNLPHLDTNSCLGDSSNQSFEKQLYGCIVNSMQLFSSSRPPSNLNSKYLSINANFKTKVETDSQEFANWLLNRYKVTPSIKIRELANRLAFRLTTLFDLQETITKMRELCSTADTARENELYTISSIQESEKYKLLKNQCQFFAVIIKYINLDRISDLAAKLTNELKNQGPHFVNEMSTQYDVYLNEIQTYDHWVKENEREVQRLKQNLSPLAQQYMKIFNDYLPSLDDSYNSFAIPRAIKSFRAKYNDPFIVRKVEEINSKYEEICRIYKESLTVAYKIRDLERNILDINSKIYCFDSNQVKDFEKKAEDLIERLKIFMKMVKPSNIEFEHIAEKLKGLSKKIEMIETSLFAHFEEFKNSLKNEYVQLPLQRDIAKQREELLQKIKEADQQLIESHKFVYDIREKKASLGKWSEISSELAGANVNNVYQSNYAQMEKMIICPICNCNYRNVLIEECGHIICSFCFEECRNKKNCVCPVCKKAFKPNEFEIMEKPKFFNNSQSSKQ